MGWTGLIQSPCEQDFISWGCLVQPCVYLQQHIAVFELRQKELRHLARISNVGSCSDFIPNLFWIVTSSLVIIWQCNQQVTNEPHESCLQFHGQGSRCFDRTTSLREVQAGPGPSPYMMPPTLGPGDLTHTCDLTRVSRVSRWNNHLLYIFNNYYVQLMYNFFKEHSIEIMKKHLFF